MVLILGDFKLLMHPEQCARVQNIVIIILPYVPELGHGGLNITLKAHPQEGQMPDRQIPLPNLWASCNENIGVSALCQRVTRMWEYYTVLYCFHLSSIVHLSTCPNYPHFPLFIHDFFTP